MYFPPSQFSHRFGTQFYTVEIPECRVVYDKERKCKFAVYKFEIKRGRQSKTVFYRYSEIRQLHEYLCSTSIGSIANLVSFPPSLTLILVGVASLCGREASLKLSKAICGLQNSH